MRVTRQGSSVTRLRGPIVRGLRGYPGMFFAPYRASSVCRRPAAWVGAVDVVTPFRLEFVPALRIRACCFHGSSMSKRNETVGTNEKSGTVYFHLWNVRERLCKSVQAFSRDERQVMRDEIGWKRNRDQGLIKRVRKMLNGHRPWSLVPCLSSLSEPS